MLRDTARRFANRDAWSEGRAWFEARPPEPESLAHLAFFVVKESRYDTDRGLALIDRALERDPSCAVAYVYRAMILGTLLQEAPARVALAEARARGALEEDLVRTEAWMNLDLWRMDEALAGFHRLVEICPASTSAILLCTAYLQASRHEDAHHWALQAAAREPDDFRAPTYAGVALAYLGRHEEARAALSDALALRADSPLVHHTLAWIAYDEEDLAAAERHLRDALAADPLYVTSRKMLGDVCARTDRAEEAREHYDEALRSFPDYAAARTARESLG